MKGAAGATMMTRSCVQVCFRLALLQARYTGPYRPWWVCRGLGFWVLMQARSRVLTTSWWACRGVSLCGVESIVRCAVTAQALPLHLHRSFTPPSPHGPTPKRLSRKP